MYEQHDLVISFEEPAQREWNDRVSKNWRPAYHRPACLHCGQIDGMCAWDAEDIMYHETWTKFKWYRTEDCEVWIFDCCLICNPAAIAPAEYELMTDAQIRAWLWETYKGEANA